MNFINRESTEFVLKISISSEYNHYIYSNGKSLPNDFDVCITGKDKDLVNIAGIDFLKSLTCHNDIYPIEAAIDSLKTTAKSFSCFNNNIDISYETMSHFEGEVLYINV